MQLRVGRTKGRTMSADKTSSRGDEALIERDIERTQDKMGETVQKLEEKMSPREIARSVVGEDGREIGREIIDLTRQHPIPVAMIAVGSIWLLATARTPGMQRLTDRIWSREKSDFPDLRSRSEEPAPIGPSPPAGERLDRRTL